MKKKMMITMIACLGVVHLASAQKAAIKTNLLYDATTTFNLGADGLGAQWVYDGLSPSHRFHLDTIYDMEASVSFPSRCVGALLACGGEIGGRQRALYLLWSAR